jgi:hypothetical protein
MQMTYGDTSSAANGHETHASTNELALPELLDLTTPAVAIAHQDACWEVHLRASGKPGLVRARLLEILPGQLPEEITSWRAPTWWDMGDFLAEACRFLSQAGCFSADWRNSGNACVQGVTGTTNLPGLPSHTVAVTALGVRWEVHLRPAYEPNLISVVLVKFHPKRRPTPVAVWPAHISSSWGDFLGTAYTYIVVSAGL